MKYGIYSFYTALHTAGLLKDTREKDFVNIRV